MKAVIYTCRREDRILEFRDDFPDIDWTILWSPGDLEAAVGDASLVIFSNRVCTPVIYSKSGPRPAFPTTKQWRTNHPNRQA